MAKIELVGHQKLAKALKKNATMDDVKRVVKQNGSELNQRMKKNTQSAFTKGYSTGDTAGSINTTISDGGMTAIVGPTTEYAPYVEFGTRFMEAEPFVRPAFEEQSVQFKKDMNKLVK